MPLDVIKVNNRKFNVSIELKNIKRTTQPDDKGLYQYVFDIYIEGKLSYEQASTYRKNIDWIISEIKNGLKQRVFL